MQGSVYKGTRPHAHTPVQSDHTIKHSKCTPHTIKKNHHHKEEDQSTHMTPAPAIKPKRLRNYRNELNGNMDITNEESPHNIEDQ